MEYVDKELVVNQECRQNLWVGVGFQQGSLQKLIAIAIEEVFQKNLLNEKAIAGIATIDTKASNTALVELCTLRYWLLTSFSAAKLSNVAVPNPSKIITKATGTPSVAEAAAILAAAKNAELGAKLIVPKYIFRLPGQPAVTVAVAEEMQA